MLTVKMLKKKFKKKDKKKPSMNKLLRLQVIDFGSSCYEQQQIYTYIQSRYYRAPEVILGTRYSCAIDIWSLACVIGELFTSQPLFAGEDEHDQLAAIMEVSPWGGRGGGGH